MRASKSRVRELLRLACEKPLHEAVKIVTIVMTTERGAFRVPVWNRFVEKDKRLKMVVTGLRYGIENGYVERKKAKRLPGRITR